jgi:dienelactone hydrolase
MKLLAAVALSALSLFACNRNDASSQSAVASASSSAAAAAPSPAASPATSPATSARQDKPDTEKADHEVVTFPSGALMLTGYLWLPPGAGPHRAIVNNHGSEKKPGRGGKLAAFYNRRGFALFIPVRRGHDPSPGTHVSDLTEAAPKDKRADVMVAELVAQVDDVLAGLKYLESRSEIRKDAIAIAGCSYGGIETVLTSERASAFKVAVDFAGASESWKGNVVLQKRLLAAVDHATIPIFFLQAENDYNTDPTKVLSAEMDRVKKPNQKKLFPPHGTTNAEGHGGFCTSPEDWGTEVGAWLDSHLPK